MEKSRERGIVKWYDATKGYGFITTDVGSKDIFVHNSNIETLDRQLENGERVEFVIEQGPKGLQAMSVSVISEES